MNNKIFYFLFFIISFSSYGNLLISPTRIVFDERQRVAKVFVINNADEPRTYRLEWQEKIAQSQGGYKTLGENEINPNSLVKMIRMSPSQVTLKPGERQVVKLALRKPRGLESKEYRSHLALRALPNDFVQKQSSVRLSMILSYTLPVILREGAIVPTVDIDTVNVRSTTTNTKYFELSLVHSGHYSSIGKIEIFQKDIESNKEKLVALVNDFSIYPELDSVSLKLPLMEGKTLAKSGQLRVVYTGQQEYKGNIFSEKVISYTNKETDL